MARLTLARKIASITLVVWKKGVGFDAKHLKHTQLERLVRSGSFAVSFRAMISVLPTPWSRVSIHNPVEAESVLRAPPVSW